MRMLLSAGSMPRASNGQTRIPLVGTRERRRSLCCLPSKRHPRVVAKSVSVRASTTRWRSRRTPKSRTCSAMSKQASKQATGRAAHAAGQFSRIRCMRRTPGATPRAGSKHSVTHHPGCPPGPAPTDATWLILPVVICLSQRLSHACVSMN